ncbi:hypothetical protein JHK82_031957 [Glycine max]|nr:hypothetical protein JHK86_032054 [Glycine max]KAG5125220.1 hypothetical protein JHK82_031957 [Glycine max]KAG5146645.1 hypothetical protein JHK84_032188 [Glycine max]
MITNYEVYMNPSRVYTKKMLKWIRFIGLVSRKRKNRSVCSASIIWGNNHHIHLAMQPTTRHNNTRKPNSNK